MPRNTYKRLLRVYLLYFHSIGIFFWFCFFESSMGKTIFKRQSNSIYMYVFSVDLHFVCFRLAFRSAFKQLSVWANWIENGIGYGWVWALRVDHETLNIYYSFSIHPSIHDCVPSGQPCKWLSVQTYHRLCTMLSDWIQLRQRFIANSVYIKFKSIWIEWCNVVCSVYTHCAKPKN